MFEAFKICPHVKTKQARCPTNRMRVQLKGQNPSHFKCYFISLPPITRPRTTVECPDYRGPSQHVHTHPHISVMCYALKEDQKRRDIFEFPMPCSPGTYCCSYVVCRKRKIIKRTSVGLSRFVDSHERLQGDCARRWCHHKLPRPRPPTNVGGAVSA